ncbi:hypothetical protein N9H60_01550 [Flavimaricola sp.]|nr:hypothetical protein [Flavimaricola sp.]MDA9019847.1 hypothetical protein [Flavimaricola sp.]
MAPPPGQPLFLARAGYRQRRLRDALRLLPVLGAILWMLPLLWPKGSDEGYSNGNALIYIFAVWVLLIGAALLMSRRLRPEGAIEEAEDAER